MLCIRCETHYGFLTNYRTQYRLPPRALNKISHWDLYIENKEF